MRPPIPDTPAQSALTKAFVAQCDASRKGFDWEHPRDALAKVREEAEEVGSLLAAGGAATGDAAAGGAVTGDKAAGDASTGDATPGDATPGDASTGDAETEDAAPGKDSAETDERLCEELGDLLFAVVNVARLAGIDPRATLDRATAKFRERFAEVERLARIRDLPMPGTPLADLDRLWDEIKAGNEG